eukprot:CAMPEP_0202694426 /NCGR_PEP_ID=MMETSP1385-20130828/8294_1 /ASSEMBLY_ACC=CAM_ASM_000861 /TAXON_ID=933848 /ORGANISM="Elphidium margaritaceum" /LENGTH=100 /DNA_ID=CAMNT_0049350271 /DNA_START=454 /DNA_END=756 /DNA_ORIENTATION=+
MVRNGANLGASGSVYGLMAFVTMKAPQSSLLLYGLFPMRLWQTMGLIVFAESFFLLRKTKQRREHGDYSQHGGVGISHEAHLAGIGVGFLYYFGVLQGML